MRLSGLVVCMWLIAAPALAFVTVEPGFETQYEPHPIESDFYTRTTYLGTLTGDPHLYQITVDVADTLPLTLYQPVGRESVALGLLVVEVLGKDKGVGEVARQNIAPADWSLEKNAQYGISLRAAPILEVALTPATYLIEVSAPENKGAYALALGVDEARPGFWAKLGAVRDVQSHFGYSFFRMLASSLVYWPIGIGLLLYALYRLYKLHMNL